MSNGTEIPRKKFFFMWIRLGKSVVLFFSQKFQWITEIEIWIFGRIGSTPLSPPEIPRIKLNGTIIPSKKFSNTWLFLERLCSFGNFPDSAVPFVTNNFRKLKPVFFVQLKASMISICAILWKSNDAMIHFCFCSSLTCKGQSRKWCLW